MDPLQDDDDDEEVPGADPDDTADVDTLVTARTIIMLDRSRGG